MKTYTGIIEKLDKNQVFVFGSNVDGFHGAGAAAYAFKFFGAKWNQGRGPQGQSYAICTKDLNAEKHPSVSRAEIMRQIKDLYFYAEQHKDKEFLIAYSGTGKNLSHYTNEEMAEMFACTRIPGNIVFEESFSILVKEFVKKRLTVDK
jgi:hypothetical protein